VKLFFGGQALGCGISNGGGHGPGQLQRQGPKKKETLFESFPISENKILKLSLSISGFIARIARQTPQDSCNISALLLQ
jgi:hypothetical protein